MAFDRSKYIESFKAEVRDLLQETSAGLLQLEKNPHDRSLAELLMRKTHTIKGSATMMGYKRIVDLAHVMEDAFEKVLKENLSLSKEQVDLLFKCLDAIEPLLDDKVTWSDKGIEASSVSNLCEEVKNLFSHAPSQAPQAVPQPAQGSQGIEKEVVDVSQKSSALQSAVEESIRVDIDKLNRLMNLTGEMIVGKIRLNELVQSLNDKVEGNKELDENLGGLTKDFNMIKNNMDRLSKSLQDEVMKIRLVPVSYLFNHFSRAMRDLARTKGKEIRFEIHGEDTQIDKAIIDHMKDPIMHLLRNAVDHGIEMPQARQEKGKPIEGKITLSAYREGSRVVIEVADDGHGVNIDKVKERAVAQGFVAQERLSDMVDDQIYQILFAPGFTTTDEVSETSGRGVGLDVVRDHIAEYKGMVEVKSKPGLGTSFLLRLPLTLAIAESLLVAAGTDIFAIPIETVMETLRVDPSAIKTIETKEAITVKGHILPLVRLSDIFNLPRKGIFEKRFLPVVVVQSVEKRIGILVDELIGRQDIISKAIGDPLKNVSNISGATILGNGRVILILDIASVIRSAEGVVIKKPSAPPKALVKGKKKTVLLAEDVLSTAMLEKSILEAAGFSVVIARDGKEALDRANQESFDLIITDVLMPRMDGFDFVASLRKIPFYKEIPVMIVTTRETDEDKRRGLEVGADAYILKKDFTSEGLLETIERLLG